MHLQKFIAVTLIISNAYFAGTVSAAQPKPLVIKEQGSFAAGGTVITAPGKFDPEEAFSNLGTGSNGNNGQTLHGDHLTASYQIPVNAKNYPWCFYTEQDNQHVPGILHPMAGKVLKPFLSGAVTVST